MCGSCYLNIRSNFSNSLFYVIYVVWLDKKWTVPKWHSWLGIGSNLINWRFPNSRVCPSGGSQNYFTLMKTVYRNILIRLFKNNWTQNKRPFTLCEIAIHKPLFLILSYVSHATKKKLIRFLHCLRIFCLRISHFESRCDFDRVPGDFFNTLF